MIYLEIEGWLPGTKPTDKVRIVERLGPNMTQTFVADVPLKTARTIIAAFDLVNSAEDLARRVDRIHHE